MSPFFYPPKGMAAMEALQGRFLVAMFGAGTMFKRLNLSNSMRCLPTTTGWVRGFALLLLIGPFGYTTPVVQAASPGRLPWDPGPNIVLITVDTLRADRLEPYGYRLIKTPQISRLASDGILFDRAIAQVPLTLPSHCSIMTGTYPFSTGVRDQAGFVLADNVTTLAESLKKAGYDTAAFVASSVLEARTGLAQGFDIYSDPTKGDKGTLVGPEGLERRGDAIVAEALKWIEAPGRKKFFVWIHLYETHAPYRSPESYASRYRKHPYDGAIAYVDSILGAFLQSAISRGWYDRSIIVFTSDHGESLGDHGEQTHGFFLYDATLRVPLIVKLPRFRWRGTKVVDQVRSIDIAPTILELAGLKREPEIQGESLLSRMARKANPSDLVAYSETYFPYYHFKWSPLFSLRTSKYLYIKAPLPELYDLALDPGEKENIAPKNPAVCSTFAEQLSTKYMKLTVESVSGERADSELYERLRSLGYIGMPRTSKKPPSALLPDPKDKLAVYLLLQEAIEDATKGRVDESIRKLRQVLQQDDQIIDAYLNLGVNYAEQERFVEAASSFKSVLSLDDRNVLATFNLALCYARLGEWNEAIVGFRRTLELNPRETEALIALGRAYQIQGEFARASEVFQTAIAQQPNLTEVHSYLADVYRALGMVDKAAAEAREANRLSHKK